MYCFFQIVFTNDNTGEYLFFVITVVVLPPDDIVDVLSIVTEVRQPIKTKIDFENIYDKPVTITYESKTKSLRALNPVLHLEPGTKVSFENVDTPYKLKKKDKDIFSQSFHQNFFRKYLQLILLKNITFLLQQILL